ncbi:MAG: hypothetical protein M2R45_01167 [Verrucomicrobia subdivision 3 bacterium]|nr:hypothetical protein [Limisphaerales bacterium]MCS1415280.1 hypothetical protein [Limisphaerales bacterium]
MRTPRQSSRRHKLLLPFRIQDNVLALVISNDENEGKEALSPRSASTRWSSHLSTLGFLLFLPQTKLTCRI